ncbi:MAG: acyltransferase family protein [Bacillus sp. (in: firmicutes)]
MPNPSNAHSRYISGLDGLRALAVFAVIAYHMRPDLIPGGLLGVTIFFVLSGYLITNLLLIEWDTHNRIDLKIFWVRRAKRLLPAMFAMLFLLTAWVTIFEPAYLAKLREDFIAASLYVSNWWYIFQDLSYFENMGTPSLLTHFWSLAVEEQFYILWPLLMLLGFISKAGKKRMVLMTCLVAILSALLMALMYEPGLDPSRVYYGTDTRIFSILIGAVLAFLWPSQKLSTQLPTHIRLFMDLTGAVALLAVLWMIATMGEYDPFLYQGGMVLVSLLTAIVIAVIVHPASLLNRALGVRPLRWVGLRSYGIYLWQYPIIILTAPAIQTSQPPLSRLALQVVLILLIAHLSYKFVENPLRKKKVKDIWISFKQRRRKRLSPAALTVSACCLVVFSISTIGLTAPETESSKNNSSEEKQQKIVLKKSETQNASNHIEEDEQAKKQAPASSDTSKPGNHEDKQLSENTNTGSLTVIGDSVIIDVAPFLEEQFPEIMIDGQIGRQMYEAKDVLQKAQQQGELGDNIVIALGSNGAFNEDQAEAVLSQLGSGHRIYLITTRVNRPWESNVNETLHDLASRLDHVEIIDWYTVSTGHNEYFANDGVHLTKRGAEVYSDLINEAIYK